MTWRTAATLLACAGASALAGCERDLRQMYAQPRLGPDSGSPLFADGKGSRPPPPGTLAYAQGDLAFTSGGRRGREEVAARATAEAASAPTITPATLERGRQRYDIDCAPCHSVTGDGDGLVVRRGFPRPPSLHEPRLREESDRRLYDVVTQGHGVMPALADRATPQDRWAIVAYLRALQLSQDAPAAGLPAELRASLPAASSAEPR